MKRNNSIRPSGLCNWVFQFSLLCLIVTTFSKSISPTTLTNVGIESWEPINSMVNTRWKRQICCCCPIILTCCATVPPMQAATVMHSVPILQPILIPLPISGPRPIMMPISHPLVTVPPQPVPVTRPIAMSIFQLFPIPRSFGMAGVSCCVCCMPVCVRECITHCTTFVCGSIGRKKRAIAMNKYYTSDRPLLS